MSEKISESPTVPVVYVQERIRWLKERCEFWNAPDKAFFEHLLDQAFSELQQKNK